MADQKVQLITGMIKTFIEQGGDLRHLRAVSTDVQKVVDEQTQSRLVTITSSIELTAGQKNHLQLALDKRFGAELDYQFQLDPMLIGGLRIQFKDQLIDMSLARQLHLLTNQLKHASV